MYSCVHWIRVRLHIRSRIPKTRSCYAVAVQTSYLYVNGPDRRAACDLMNGECSAYCDRVETAARDRATSQLVVRLARAIKSGGYHTRMPSIGSRSDYGDALLAAARKGSAPELHPSEQERIVEHTAGC